MKSLIRKITNSKFIFRIQVFYILMYLLFSGRINVYISFTVAISLNIASLILIVCNMKKDFGIKTHPEVCLSAVTRCAPTVGPKDGSFTLQYKSAIAFGKAEIVTEDAEKIHGLRLISERFLPQHMDAFDESIARSLSRTAVVMLS